MEPVRLSVWSDYLCPWCHQASHRLRAVQEEFGERLEISWRSYLLRPQPAPGRRDLEKFRRYTQSWLRPAAEPDAAEFRPWSGDAGPPSHSVPPHLCARAAAQVGRAAFERVHDALLRAYFVDNRDVSSRATLLDLWDACGLAKADFDRVDDPDLLREVADDHNEAIERGMSGVPAVAMERIDAFITGAQPRESYRRWIQRRIDGVI